MDPAVWYWLQLHYLSTELTHLAFAVSEAGELEGERPLLLRLVAAYSQTQMLAIGSMGQ
jgi:hypothetical protein